MHAQRLGAETTNREHGTVEREWRNDSVDARAVFQASVNHWRRFVDATTDRRNDALDNAHQVFVVFELDTGFLEFAAALDVDVVGRVNQNVGDRSIGEQLLEWSETEELVPHFVDQTLTLDGGERRV